MTRISLTASLVALVTSFAARAALADDIKCDPAAKKLEWHVCVTGPAEYQRGIKKEVRDECVVDKVIKTDGCKLGDVRSQVPAANQDMKNVYLYAIGPVDLEMRDYEKQMTQTKKACNLHEMRLDAWKLMKFGDAPDQDNSARSKLVEEKLKAAGKKIFTGLTVRYFDAKSCAGGDAALALMNKKTTEFLVYATTKW